jgi:hypothetical protein
MVITLLVAVSALLLAIIASVMLDPRSRFDQDAEEAAEERYWTMKATPFF